MEGACEMRALAKASAGKQMRISSIYQEFCADCRKITDHEYLLSNLVQCKACYRLIQVKGNVLMDKPCKHKEISVVTIGGETC